MQEPKIKKSREEPSATVGAENSKKLNNENDTCVCCDCDTGIPKTMPISKRQNYIIGAGQLCNNCYVNLYIRHNEDEN